MASLREDLDPMIWRELDEVELPNGDTYVPAVKRQYRIAVDTPHGVVWVQVELQDGCGSIRNMHLAKPVLASQTWAMSSGWVHDRCLVEIQGE